MGKSLATTAFCGEPAPPKPDHPFSLHVLLACRTCRLTRNKALASRLPNYFKKPSAASNAERGSSCGEKCGSRRDMRRDCSPQPDCPFSFACSCRLPHLQAYSHQGSNITTNQLHLPSVAFDVRGLEHREGGRSVVSIATRALRLLPPSSIASSHSLCLSIAALAGGQATRLQPSVDPTTTNKCQRPRTRRGGSRGEKSRNHRVLR